jgi:hypothetical protein
VQGECKVLERFVSPDTGVAYPTVMRVSIPAIEAHPSFVVRAVVADQRQWPADQGEIYEGAVDVCDEEVRPTGRLSAAGSARSDPAAPCAQGSDLAGVGYLEHMAWTSQKQLAEQQAAALGLDAADAEKIAFSPCSRARGSGARASTALRR